MPDHAKVCPFLAEPHFSFVSSNELTMAEADIIRKVIGVLSSSPDIKNRYSAEIKDFNRRLSLAQSHEYRLGVIGVTSSGKSTMINALLGENLLPSGAQPSSNQLVSCRHSDTRVATVYFANDRKQQFSGQDMNVILMERYGDERTNKSNKESVKQIEVQSKLFPFSKDILMVDSPGLDAFGYASHEKLTLSTLLPTVDMCIFVTTCKTNSDDKTLTILNTIADNDKPVIIVQNMLDAVKPSPDGKKSAHQVAQEHIKRVEKIIATSNIKDKSAARIVQISAIQALDARMGKAGPDILKKSNYQQFVDAVNSAFDYVRPRVEGRRLTNLKNEILRIAGESEKCGPGIVVLSQPFEFEGVEDEMDEKKEKALDVIKDKFDELENYGSRIESMTQISQTDLDDIVREEHECEEAILSEMKEVNQYFTTLANRLNIDSRDIFNNFQIEKPSAPSLKTKTYTVTRTRDWDCGDWFSLGIARLFRDNEITETRTRTDVARTKEEALNQIRSCLRAFAKTAENWEKSVDKSIRRISDVIDNRREAYNKRQWEAQNAQRNYEAAQKVARELKNIASGIATVADSKPKGATSVGYGNDANLSKAAVGRLPFNISMVSQNIREVIHRQTMAAVLKGKASVNVVVGWDKTCEREFLWHGFGVKAGEMGISDGFNQLTQSLSLVHKPKMPLKTYLKSAAPKNLLFLVNATQIGAAAKEMAQCDIGNALGKADHLFLVVQDLQEVINGGSLEEAPVNMRGLKEKLGLPLQPTILFLHDNPVYNMAAVESQRSVQTHSDEVNLMGDLQSKFNYLIDEQAKTQLPTIIKNLHKI